jgi:hypothetical protein
MIHDLIVLPTWQQQQADCIELVGLRLRAPHLEARNKELENHSIRLYSETIGMGAQLGRAEAAVAVLRATARTMRSFLGVLIDLKYLNGEQHREAWDLNFIIERTLLDEAGRAASLDYEAKDKLLVEILNYLRGAPEAKDALMLEISIQQALGWKQHLAFPFPAGTLADRIQEMRAAANNLIATYAEHIEELKQGRGKSGSPRKIRFAQWHQLRAVLRRTNHE